MTTTAIPHVAPTGPPLDRPRLPDRLRLVGGSLSTAARSPFALPVAVAGAATAAWAAGFGDLPRAMRDYPFDIPAIFIALEVFTGLVIGTGVGDALAVQLGKRSRGRPLATLALSVVVLMATCVLGNNLSHVGIVLPVLLILLSTLSSSRRYLVGYLSCVMAVVNLAGASTPVGDFPALTIMASGITSFSAYLSLAFPLFGVLTTGTLLGVYLLVLRPRRARDHGDGFPPEAGSVLLAARLGHVTVDRGTLARLGAILAGMFASWVLLPEVPAWAIAWGGAALAVTLSPKASRVVRIDAVDLLPVLRIGSFLAAASYLATTGVLEAVAASLQEITDPRLLLITMMLSVAGITSVVSAGPTAAVLLPVALSLVAPGAALAGHGDLVAVAFAAAICAGSSAFLISATAGPLIARRAEGAGLVDETGRPVHFTARDYLPFGLLNAAVQLAVGVGFVLVLYAITGS